MAGLGVGWLALGAHASTGPASPELEKAQKLLEAGEFEAAVEMANRGLAAADLSDDQLVELYRLLGLAQLYLGDENEARSAFEKLLQARPDFELPKGSPPKVQKLYARIKDDIRKRRVRPITLNAEPIGDRQGGQATEVLATIEAMGPGTKAKLYYRRIGTQAYSSVDFRRQQTGPENFTAQIPAFELPAESGPYEIEYYLEVADAAQRRLAGKGDAYSPLTFRVLPLVSAPKAKEPAAWYQSPWLWVGVGVVAAGATAGIILATQQPSGSLPITVRLGEP